MKGNQTVDPRVRKTKRAIRNAFAKLLSEKEIDTITIREVSELSEINRKTFYRYYRGIYQVVDEIEDEVVNAFENVLNDVDMNTALEDPYRIFEGLTSIIDTDIVFYGHLLSMQKNASLASKITAVLKEKTKQAMIRQLTIEEKLADVILEYVSAGMIAVYRQWFLSGNRDSVKTISTIISLLTIYGIKGVLEQYKEKKDEEPAGLQ